MTTYNPSPDAPRFDYAQRCLWSLNYNLRSNKPIRYVLADDGSPDVKPLYSVINKFHASSANDGVVVEVVTGPHNGIGASLNRAMDLVNQQLWLYTTDDWELQDVIHLTMAEWLIEQKGYDLVRLGPMHPNVTCVSKFEYPFGWWWDIDVSSNQYACATRPFLAGPSLMHKVGLWLEGVDGSYAAEVAFGITCQQNGVRAASLYLDGPWNHIGDYEVGNRPV